MNLASTSPDRLWCVFELAAYKKVNPEGRITFRPLFIERVVAVMMASTYIFGMVFLILRDLLGPGIIMFTFSFAMWVVPYTVGILAAQAVLCGFVLFFLCF